MSSTPTTPQAPDPRTPPDSAGTAQDGPAQDLAGGGPAGDALLRLSGVSKIYGDLHALDNVSLEIPRGQWVSIVGPSGSGKTTLMNIVGAMDTATKGTVALDGHDISDLTGDELTEIRCRNSTRTEPPSWSSPTTPWSPNRGSARSASTTAGS